MAFCPVCRGEVIDDGLRYDPARIYHKMDCRRDERIWAAAEILWYDDAGPQEIIDALRRASYGNP